MTQSRCHLSILCTLIHAALIRLIHLIKLQSSVLCLQRKLAIGAPIAKRGLVSGSTVSSASASTPVATAWARRVSTGPNLFTTERKKKDEANSPGLGLG